MKIFSFKSKKATVFLAVCGLIILFVCTFLSGKTTFKKNSPTDSTPDPSPDGNPCNFKLNDGIITRLVLDNLPEDLPLKDVVVHISDYSAVTLDCKLSPTDLLSFCQSRKINIPKSITLISNLLPDAVDSSFTFRLAIDSATGHLVLTPQVISVNGIDLAKEMLPDDFSVSINTAVNSLFTDGNKTIKSMTVSEGEIMLTLEEK